MSYKEVNELRKAGRLDQALDMALKDLKEAQEPFAMSVCNDNSLTSSVENIEANLTWPKRALAWVYYEYLKRSVLVNDIDNCIRILENIKQLSLPHTESLFADNLAWQIGKLLFAYAKNVVIDNSKLSQIFSAIKLLPFTKPNESYSFLLKAFLKCSEKWRDFIIFLDWWGIGNFMLDDYSETEYEGRKIMSLVERVYISYSKKLLDPVIVIYDEGEDINYTEKRDCFIPLLANLVNQHPEYQYPPYFLTKLYVANNEIDKGLAALLPFAKKKRSVFWVWQLLAEIYSENKEMQLACYSKALSLGAPDKFLGKIHIALAKLLLELKMYSEAKTEIECLIHSYKKNEWNLPAVVSKMIEADWYASSSSLEDNRKLYNLNKAKAEVILYSNVSEVVVAVEFVNKKHKMLNFIHNEEVNGFFKYEHFIKSPKPGDLLKVRLEKIGKDGFHKVLTLSCVSERIDIPALRELHATLKMNAGGFGFVDNVFVSDSLIKKNQLKDAQNVKIKAILSFNKAKQQWGWKAVDII